MDSNNAVIIFILSIPLVLFVVELIFKKQQNKKYEEAEIIATEQLIKRSFRFLVDDYGFQYYELGNFQNSKMLIEVQPGHKSPRIYINKVGESALYKLEFEWIIEFFSGTSTSWTHDYLNYSLETNMVFISKIFQEYAHKLVDEFDDWWIPVHVFFYRAVEEKYRREGQTDIFLKAYKHYYEYLKNEGAI